VDLAAKQKKCKENLRAIRRAEQSRKNLRAIRRAEPKEVGKQKERSGKEDGLSRL
jgi:hypothetical protein